MGCSLRHVANASTCMNQYMGKPKALPQPPWRLPLAIPFLPLVCSFSLVRLLYSVSFVWSVDAISIYWTDSLYWWFCRADNNTVPWHEYGLVLLWLGWCIRTTPMRKITWTSGPTSCTSVHVRSYLCIPQGYHKTCDHIPGHLGQAVMECLVYRWPSCAKVLSIYVSSENEYLH
jgi:hypothetical protein